MASNGLRGLNEAMKGLRLCKDAASNRALPTAFTRSMATEAPLKPAASPAAFRPATSVPVTIFDFPSYEPKRLESWSTKHLSMPLRRDLLHLAVVYEGDNTRQGTASSKNRYEVHGSHRKMRPQKGTGMARIGNRQSPIQHGGGKTFGPHPRDFGTDMNRKVYDKAWRTALSYRYRRGELIVCEDGMDLTMPEELDRMMVDGVLNGQLQSSFMTKWAGEVLDNNHWGRKSGRSTFITTDFRDDLFDTLAMMPNYGSAMGVADVDVKDLLVTGRLIVERSALLAMIEEHQSDLVANVVLHDRPLRKAPESGNILLQ